MANYMLDCLPSRNTNIQSFNVVNKIMDWENSRRIISELDGKEYTRAHSSFTGHLRKFGHTYRSYYEEYILKSTPSCPICNKPRTFYRHNHTYAKTCGHDKCNGIITSRVLNSRTEEEWNEIKKQVSIGVKKAFKEKGDQILDRRHKTCSEVGKDGLTKYQRTTNKGRQTKKKKYGDPYYNNSKKISETKLNHAPEKRDEINEKRKATMKEKFGVENNFQRICSIRNSRKGNASIKDYILPSGKKIGVRGFEPMVIDELLKSYKETDLVICDEYSEYEIPIFEYVNFNKHKLNYYPDIYIPKENRIIEVKSQWWYDGLGKEKYKGRLENNLRKKIACVKAGYNFEFWIFKTKSEYEVIK